jgi:hypothetical protein
MKGKISLQIKTQEALHFRHRILQDHFAKMWEKEKCKVSVEK